MERLDKAVITMPHQVILQERKCVEMIGVSDVDSFDDTVVVAYTPLGELTVRGRELQVRQLSIDTGSLAIEGQIDSLSYTEINKGGFLSRLLR